MPFRTFKTGLRLGRHNLALSLFSSVIAGGKLPTAAPACDWLSPVKVPWGMLGNDRNGDCVFAAILHVIMAMAAATGRQVPAFTAADAIALYHVVVPSFDPNAPLDAKGDNPTDQGSDFDTAGDYWQRVGIGGTKIISRVRVNPGNLNLIKLAIDWLGPVLVGLALPDNAEDQFGKRWEMVPGKPPNPDNGHEIMVGGYDGDEFEAVSWGAVQPLTADWLLQCSAPSLGGDWQAVVTDQWIRANQLSPSELHLETIQRDAGLLLTAM